MKLVNYNTDAEESLLVACMMDNRCLDDVLEAVSPSDFYHGQNAIIFEAVKSLHEQNKPVDVAMVAQILLETGRLAKAGGSEKLSHLLDTAPFATHPVEYARNIAKLSAVRGIEAKCKEIIARCSDGGEPEDIISEAQRKILEVSAPNSKDNFTDIKSIMPGFYKEVLAANETEKSSGYKLGFDGLDRILHITGSKLIIIAARPMVGKTSFLVSIAIIMANAGVKIGFLSLEMARDEILKRMLAIESSVNLMRLGTYQGIYKNELNQVRSAKEKLEMLPIIIDDQGSLSIDDVERKCRKLKKEGCQIILIDQLSQINGRKGQSEFERYTENCNRIARLKKEIGLPIFLLAQINRDAEKRNDKEPRLSDLKNTGSIEEDADIVILLHRPEVEEKDPQKKALLKGKTIVNVAKNRQGSTYRDESIYFDARLTHYRDSIKTDTLSPDPISSAPSEPDNDLEFDEDGAVFLSSGGVDEFRN